MIVTKLSKNKNSSIKKQLYEELQERRKNILAFIDCEFLPEESIVTLKGLLNDEKIRFMEDVKMKFTEGVKSYDLTDNQITFINAVMLAIAATVLHLMNRLVVLAMN